MYVACTVLKLTALFKNCVFYQNRSSAKNKNQIKNSFSIIFIFALILISNEVAAVNTIIDHHLQNAKYIFDSAHLRSVSKF